MEKTTKTKLDTGEARPLTEQQALAILPLISGLTKGATTALTRLKKSLPFVRTDDIRDSERQDADDYYRR